MRFVRTAIVAAAASAALAGAAFAARERSDIMLVALPDGTVHHVEYREQAPPRLLLVPISAPPDLFEAAFGPGSPFAEMERLSALMAAQSQAMLRDATALQGAVPAGTGKGIVMTDARGEPVGVMHYSFISSSTSADGCTRTIRYSSDGGDATQANPPQVIRTSSGSCGAAPQAAPITPTRSAPTALRREPTITPVSVPAPLARFTPSRT